VHPEVEELRPKLKEILYDCAVEIRATKAALYLLDNEGRRFELVTEYGFRGNVRPHTDRNDPIVDRCGRGRTPFFINGLTVEPRFSQIMYDGGSERLLAAPVYLRGSLVGVIDMRDKAGKAAFDSADVPKAQKIADQIGALFAAKNPFGLRFIALSESEGGATVVTPPLDQGKSEIAPMPANLPQVMPKAAPAPAPAARPVDGGAATSTEKRPPLHVPRLATLVVDARARAANVVVQPQPESIGENELAAVREVLKSILMIPGVVTATFSAFGHMGGIQETAARSALTDEATNFLQSKLNVWLTKRGDSAGFLRSSMQTPLGVTGSPVSAAQLQKVFTAPVVAGTMRALYLTVAFGAVPDRASHEMLASGLNQLQLAIEHSMNRTALQTMRMRVAEALIEPDFMKFPELGRHTDLVVARVEQFARSLALPPAEAENVKLVAMVHDCGLRLLEYERLYKKKDLSPEELSVLKEHVYVGAAIVEPLLGAEIARAVLCHHERVDGRGYPNELHGDDIPYASRIVQLCDAWVAMTDSDSYQDRIESPESAIAIITRGAGSQFDADLARKFVDQVRTMSPQATARA
jgi:hypothetical protein